MARPGREGRPARALSRIAVVVALVAVVGVAAVSVYLVAGGAGKAGPGSLASLVSLSIQPNPMLIAPGQVQAYPTLVVEQSGSVPNGPILLSAAGPRGLSIALSQASVSTASAQGGAPASVTLTLNSSSSILPAMYNITIKAAAGQLSEDQTFPVDVVPALVVMHQVAFVPQNLTVPRGTTVTWLNLDSNIGCCDPGYHNVVFKSGTSAYSPTLKRLQSWSYQFNTVGEYDYFCSIHPWMVGRVTVVQ
jgi:plastocyanin